jgi:hypothetical protein
VPAGATYGYARVEPTWDGPSWVPRIQQPDGQYVPLVSLDGVTWFILSEFMDRMFTEPVAMVLQDVLYDWVADLMDPGYAGPA